MREEDTTNHNFFSINLNSEQQKAVVHTQGPLLVIAGAGSGKTRVITTRIVHLILNEHIGAERIIALTFTNKAAGEMKERIAEFLPVGSRKPFIGTFHAYCLYLLKLHANLLGIDQFTILDADDQQALVTSLVKKAGLEKRMSVKQVLYHISSLKNNIPDDTAYIDPLVKQIYQLYEQAKRQSKCFDFDDLLLQILNLFSTNTTFKEQFQQTVRHILVDEYQDTNVVQHELLKAMTLKNKQFNIDSLCVVGDEDQSIYSWRGATVANILNFNRDFPDTTVITIEQNYRSVLPILQAANTVINHNKQRNPKELWSERNAHDRIRILHCNSGYQEGDAICHALKQLKKKYSLNTCAILYRAHYQSRAIEEALIRNSIPYTIIGGIQFYERKEIKDLLAYIRIVVNPFDRVSLLRIINCPHRGLGDKFQDFFVEQWDQQPFYNYADVADFLIKKDLIPASKKTTLKEFLRLFEGKTALDKPRELLESIIEKIHYFNYLHNAFDKQEAEAKIDNVKELLRAMAHFEQNGLTTALDFLNHVALMQEKIASDNNAEHKVQLMTLHAAKGLEFDTVCLTGLEEGLFPSMHSIQQQETIEEERRLFYVGITRAKERLLLSHARYRYTFGTMTDQVCSRFLNEIPDHLAQRVDCSYWNESNFNEFFSQWLFNTTTIHPSSLVTFGSAHKKERSTITRTSAHRTDKEVSWKPYQSVKHATFGVGIIKTIEQRNDETVLTVHFKTGLKKIKAAFVQSLS